MVRPVPAPLGVRTPHGPPADCEVTAPRLLTFAEAVGEISRVSGREVRYVPISVEQFASAVEALVLPPEFVGLLTYLFTD